MRIRDIDLFVLNMRTRMPFRYGIASMTALPHLFVRLEMEIDGRRQGTHANAVRAGTRQVGIASEGLAPKWFTKDPQTTFREDVADMFRVIRQACVFATEIGESPTVFDLWEALHAAQERWGAEAGYPPLLSGLGTSLVERALIEAFCRATGTPFAQAVRANTLGIRLGAIHHALAPYTAAALLPAQPLATLVARHTVGLGDPLAEADVPESERLHDGLPQALEACIRAYRLTHFKIKLFGEMAHDVERLTQIARIVEANAGGDYAFTLDGNEHFLDVPAFRHFWQELAAQPGLRAFMEHLLFVEQPLHRSVALSEDAGRSLLAWAQRPPIIIDESDGELASLPQALAAGYAGTSHKNCKGVFKGIANACLIEQRRRSPATAGQPAILSGEDLANVGPLALLQDLAAMATLGVAHVERNGHHYFAGLSMLPDAVQQAVLTHHGDLYRRHERGFPTLDVRQGRLAVGSLVRAPFGVGFPLDVSQFTPLAEWRFETLGVDE